MSFLSYNGVRLPYPVTSRFDQVAVPDPVSQTDWSLTKFDVQAQFVINANYLLFMDPDTFSGPFNIVDGMRATRVKLLEPRRRLTVQFNGVNLIPGSGQGGAGTVDAKNGPTPVSCSIHQLTDTTWFLDYHVVAHYWEKNDVNLDRGVPNAVINSRAADVVYNRWTESVDIDDCEFSTRTREGSFAIRSDNALGLPADNFRTGFAVVSVPAGFTRAGSHYTVTPDGLAIQYRVTDKEVYKMPPPGAFRAQGEYTESSTRGDGKRYGAVRVRLYGNKRNVVPGGAPTDQSSLILKAVAVCSSKLNLQGFNLRAGANEGGIIESAAVTVGMYENYVEASMRCMFPPSKRRVGGVAALRSTMAFTPFSDAEGGVGAAQQPTYRVRGTSSLLLRAAAYYDPSLQNNFLAPAPQASADNGFTPAGDAAVQTRVGNEPGTAGRNPV